MDNNATFVDIRPATAKSKQSLVRTLEPSPKLDGGDFELGPENV